MGFYAPAQLVADARRHGVEILPVDVNASDWDCTLEPPGDHSKPESISDSAHSVQPAMRLGFRQLLGLAEGFARKIMEARRESPFTSLEEFARRTELPSAALARLARGDAFGSLAASRRQALWQALRKPEQKTLFADLNDPEPAAALAPLTPLDEVIADYRTAGLSLRDHPVRFLRERLNLFRVKPAADLRAVADGKRVKVAGLVLLRQRPGTAKGITFVTLEDETGFVNLIVRPDVWERYHTVARRAQGMLAYGTLQKKDEIIHVLVEKLEDLAALPAGTVAKSRDFR
jgi:error-prone DNA polymerase